MACRACSKRWRARAAPSFAAAIERVLSGFACRYQLSNGQIATHFGVQGDSGYTPLMLNSKYLFDVEVL